MKGWKASLAAHNGVMGHVADLLEVFFDPAVELLASSLSCGGKLLLCGNGGSAADAQHFAAELVVRYRLDRPALPAIALTTDTSVLTAAANDHGYDTVFARQISALGRKADVLIAFSTSGNSPNVLRALQVAEQKMIPTIGLSGMKGMGHHCTYDFNVPSVSTARIQEAHAVLIHLLVEGIEEKLYGAA